MAIISPLLQRAINAVATCKPDTYTFGSGRVLGDATEAPYHFLFQHRQKLQQFIEDRPSYGSSIRVLLEYLESNFQQEYAEADSMFAKGLVTEGNLNKLFRPGQIVVTENKGSYDAYVLDEWPAKVSDRLIFSGWQWMYNGWILERAKWSENLKLNFLDEKRIESLKVRPLEHVEERVRTTLRERGRRFWAMRRQSLVSYDGWDYHHDYLYVSFSGVSNGNC